MALKPEIMLTRYQWFIREQVMVTGSCWVDNHCTKDVLFLDEVKKNTGDFKCFVRFCNKLNGQFSVVISNETEIWLHCCHTWSFPLFYSIKNGNVKIGDNPENLKIINTDIETDPTVKDYFTAFGITPGASTLEKSIQLVRPGESVCINLSTGQLQQMLMQIPIESESELTPEELAATIRKSFGKYAEFLQNKQVLLPLTSGYDSRLLACLLKESGVKNVICSTWGRENNNEIVTAKKVADKLGYPYISVPYTNELIEGFAHSKEFIDYAGFSGHYTSMPYLQDYFAVRHLKNKGIINEATFVLPGHPGDFLRGTHLYRMLKNETSIQVANSLLQAFGTTLPLTDTQKKQVLRAIQERIFNPADENRNNFDYWDFQERQCKFIGNSSQVYSFFNIPYLLPLFDKKIFNTLLFLPFHQRLYAKLYNHTLENKIFTENGVGFELKHEEKGFTKPSWLKEFVIMHTPAFIRKKYYPADDNVFYKEITSLLMNSYPAFTYTHPVKPNRYNSYLIQWYLQWLKNPTPGQ